MIGAQILVVEPDRRLAETYAAALTQRHYRVAVETNAQDAIIAADRVKPDLIVLELQLTAHSGVEFLYELRSYTDWRDVPVVVLSHVPPAEFTASRSLLQDHLGVVAYHYKPRTNLRVMLHAVENGLAGRAQGQGSTV